MQKSNALQGLPQVIVDCGGTKTAKNGDTNNDGDRSLLLKPKKNGAQDQSTQAASERFLTRNPMALVFQLGSARRFRSNQNAFHAVRCRVRANGSSEERSLCSEANHHDVCTCE